MQVIGMMPIRAGSKSIPKKNLRMFRGEYLFVWNLTTLIRSQICDHVFINSEAPEFYELVKNKIPRVLWYERRAELAGDKVVTIDVVKDFIENVSMKDEDVFILSQATSPYLKEKDVQWAYANVLSGRFDSVMSAGRIKRWLWHDNGLPMNRAKDKHVRRQDWKGTLIQNGCLYVTTAGRIRETDTLWGGKLGFIEQPYWFEIDELTDLQWAELVMGPPPVDTASEQIERMYELCGWKHVRPGNREFDS